MSLKEQFFVVWNPEHGWPRVKHDSYESALAEAKRLASLHKDRDFHVLTSVATARTTDPVTVTMHDDNHGISYDNRGMSFWP